MVDGEHGLGPRLVVEVWHDSDDVERQPAEGETERYETYGRNLQKGRTKDDIKSQDSQLKFGMIRMMWNGSQQRAKQSATRAVDGIYKKEE